MKTVFGNDPAENAYIPAFQFHNITIVNNNFKFYDFG